MTFVTHPRYRLVDILTGFLIVIVCTFGCGYVFYVWVVLGYSNDRSDSEIPLEERIYFGIASTIALISVPIICVLTCMELIDFIRSLVRPDKYTKLVEMEDV